jgi:hypothetical protein
MTEKKKIKKIEDAYLRSYPLEEGVEEQHKPSKKRNELPKVTLLSDREEAAITFTQLSKSSKLAQDLATNSEVLDDYSWQDFNLISGHSETPEQHLLHRIDKTTTTAGRCVLATELVSPTKSFAQLGRKQGITQTLQKEPVVAKEIGEELKKIKKGENLRCQLWQKENPLTHPEYKREVSGFFALLIRYGMNMNKKITLWRYNKNSKNSLLVGRIFSDLLLFFMPLFILAFTFLLLLLINMPIAKLLGGGNSPNFSTVIRAPGFLWSTIGTIIYTYILSYLFQIRPQMRKRRLTLDFLAKHLASWQQLWDSTLRINTLIANNPALEKHCAPYLTKTRELIAKSRKDKHLKELKEMFAYLEKLQLSKWSYFFSHTGELLRLHQLLEKKKDIFVDTIYEMGQIDVRISVFKLMEEAQQKSQENHYILSSLTESTPTTQPTLAGEGVWNIGIDANEVISNNCYMSAQEGPRMMIITGPNMGGKSTYILSMGINIILSQSLGIAAAKTWRQDIIYKVATYLDPTQNLSKKLSLADACFAVLERHSTMLQSTQGPVVMINDEILNGIDPKVAEDVGSRILANRHDKYPQCLTLLTTHYKAFTKLENLSGVVNKKVEVIMPGKYASFDATYKVIDGISSDDQNVVRATLYHRGVLKKK